MRSPLLRAFLVAALAAVPCLRAQSPDDLNEGTKVEWDSTNEIWRLKWWGKAGHTYFLQHTEDPREPWQWVPVIESGNDSVREWGFTTTGDRFFVRLRHTDIATSDPEGDDFDGDGLSNMEELLLGTDPFKADTDGDGIPDGWEVEHGLDPLDPNDAGLDGDDDGLTNLQEYTAGTDPTKFSSGDNGVSDGWWVQHGLDPYGDSSHDSDGDGRSDLEEFLHGTDPNTMDEAPDYPFPDDAPRNLMAVENPDGSYDLSWEDAATNRKRFVIRRQKDDGTWEVIAVVGPNTRSHHVAAIP